MLTLASDWQYWEEDSDESEEWKVWRRNPKEIHYLPRCRKNHHSIMSGEDIRSCDWFLFLFRYSSSDRTSESTSGTKILTPGMYQRIPHTTKRRLSRTHCTPRFPFAPNKLSLPGPVVTCANDHRSWEPTKYDLFPKENDFRFTDMWRRCRPTLPTSSAWLVFEDP